MLTYTEAIQEIWLQTGRYISKLKMIPPCPTSVVLYDPNGSALTVTDGVVLQNDVSLCYLITWLQVLVDNFMINNDGGPLIIRSIEIRFRNPQIDRRYPALQGDIAYADSGMTVALSVSWPCGGSAPELYWDAYRSLMQLTSVELGLKPIMKIKTLKHQPAANNTADPKTNLIGGHKFVVSEKLDIEKHFGQEQEVDTKAQVSRLLTGPRPLKDSTEGGKDHAKDPVHSGNDQPLGNTGLEHPGEQPFGKFPRYSP